MMNISSLATRHNPYVQLPDGGTYLSAATRARLLKDIEIRFGDVRKRSDTGKLALGHLDMKDKHRIRRVRDGRLYE